MHPAMETIMAAYNPRVTPWQIDETRFRSLVSPESRIRFLLRYAVLAPSGHNTQPWKFAVKPDGVFFYADYSRRLPVVDPDDRELLTSVGAAMANFRVAAAHFGYGTDVRYQHEHDSLLASVRLTARGATDPGLGELFPAITRRRTNRGVYEDRPLTDADLDRLRQVSGHGTGVLILTDQEIKDRAAGLVHQGNVIQFADKEFRRELAAWVRPNRTRAGDGIPGDAFGIPDLVSYLGPWVIRTLDQGRKIGDDMARKTRDAAALVCIRGDDTQECLLEAGEVLERLLLTCTLLGIQNSYLNMPIEVAVLRPRLQEMLGLQDPPQILMRVGYGTPPERATPRRRITEVLA